MRWSISSHLPALDHVPGWCQNTPGVTVTRLTDGISYDFRVTAAISGTATDASGSLYGNTNSSLQQPSLQQILSTGQSLSVGWDRSPPLSTHATVPVTSCSMPIHRLLFRLVEPATNAQPNLKPMSSGYGNMLSYLTQFAKHFKSSPIVTLKRRW